MYRFNQRDIIKRNVPNFLKQYEGYQIGSPFYRGSECKALKTLDLDTANAEMINAIIGNDTWTRAPYCDECGNQSWNVVQLGQEPDYESSTANICLDCLKRAIALIEGEGV